MNVFKVVTYYYSSQWTRLLKDARQRKIPVATLTRVIGEDHRAIESFLSLDKVQKFVNRRIAASSTPKQELNKHHQTLRRLAGMYARILFRMLQRSSRRSNFFEPEVYYVNTILIMKRHAMGCGIYPCYNPENDRIRTIENSPLPTGIFGDLKEFS